MKNKQSLIVFLFLCTCYWGFGQIVAWEMNGLAGNEAMVNATTINANLNVSTLSRGSGLSASLLGNAFSSTNFTATGSKADAITNNKYLQFQISSFSGYQVSLSTLNVNFRRSSTGPNAFIWQYSIDGTIFTDIGTTISYSSTTNNGDAQAQIDLSSISSLQNVAFGTTITFRLYGWGASATTGTFAIGRLAGNDLAITGSVSTISPSPELQLVDNSAANQNCGYSIDFGSKALSTNTDLTFDVKNVGSADLTVSSFGVTGDYSVVSPATPFTVTSGNSTTVILRFIPTATGTRAGILTINSNDGDEGSCVVNLSGVGYTPAPEINVEGNLGSYPDIPNNDTTPSGTDNTLFAAQFIGASQSKSYRINNDGTADLILSGITFGGANPEDFAVSISPTNTIAPSTFSILEITFSPLGSGPRNATVSIVNNDGDENPFTFAIRGMGNCVSSSLSIAPSSGPVGTTITVSGTNFGLSTTAKLSGINAPVKVLSSTTIEVIVPNNAKTGNLEIVNDLGCTSSILFNVIDKTVGGCEGGSPLSDLIISEVTDATTGGLTYIEIYNGTGGNVQLNNYSLEIYSNGNATASGAVSLDPGNLSNNSTYVVAIGVAGSPNTTNTCSITGGNGQLANKPSGISGINKKDNEHDAIRLLKSSGTVVVDQFGVYMDSNWMDATTITGDRGFNFRRLITASPLPNPGGFNLTDWNIIDWVGSGQSSCDTNDYSDIGFYDFSTASSPLVSSGPTINSNCNTATISISGNEGYSGGNGLTYQWYYSAQGDSGWTALTNDATYNNVTSSTLNILDISLLGGYQYYCQIRENDSSCYKASDAVQMTLPKTIWNGTTWSNGLPTIATAAILNGNYNTSTNGNFRACSLIVNNGYTLNIEDGTYVEVENNLTVNGNVIVQSKGAFVQNNDAAIVDGAVLSNKTKIVVNKRTAISNNWYEYTYWSSPVKGETIADGLYESAFNRRFLFNAKNYLDHCAETNNNNICDDNGGLGLQDGIDDDGNDWQWVGGTTVMQPGVGYASTHDSIIFGSTPGCLNPGGCSIEYTFEGPFHNGTVSVPVYRNDTDLNDINWNLIGNPYPSAISADAFLAENAVTVDTVSLSPPFGVTTGAIFFWSQYSPPSNTNNGNENLNFAQSDYAIINWTAQTAGGDGIMPDRYIPSGQGFFVAYDNTAPGTLVPSSTDPIYEGRVTFKNSMRMADGISNNKFFRTTGGNSTNSKKIPNKLWINLTSNNGVFSQVAVGYVYGATADDDGIAYDTPRTFTNQIHSNIFTMNVGLDKKFGIQGKAPIDLSLNEVIPLGFGTSINVPTIYKLSLIKTEGEFLSSNPVYLKDHLMNIVHNLSESDYSFTSDVGEFKDRFELTFQSGTLSDNSAQLSLKSLSIIELHDGRVQFKVNDNQTINSIQIMDVLGRTLYQLKGSGSSEIYDLSNLSQSVYIARVELSDGQIITKRALKRR